MGLDGEDKPRATKLRERENLSASPSISGATAYLDNKQMSCAMQRKG